MAENRLAPWSWGRGPGETKGMLAPFEDLRKRINDLFEESWSGFGLTPFRPFGEGFGEVRPRVDVSETDKEIEISAELPGMDQEDVEVMVTEDRLTIRGEKKAEREQKDKGYHLVERSYGSFQRSFQLPSGIDTDKIDAGFNKGVLTVTLPKTAEAQKAAKKVAIKSK